MKKFNLNDKLHAFMHNYRDNMHKNHGHMVQACKKNIKAFSIIEIMVIMLIMNIILATAAPIIIQKSLAPIAASATASAVPIGSVIYFASKIAPDGYLECDGTILGSEAKYSKLKVFLGTTYGANGQLPDLSGGFETHPRNVALLPCIKY